MSTTFLSQTACLLVTIAWLRGFSPRSYVLVGGIKTQKCPGKCQCYYYEKRYNTDCIGISDGGVGNGKHVESNVGNKIELEGLLREIAASTAVLRLCNLNLTNQLTNQGLFAMAELTQLIELKLDNSSVSRVSSDVFAGLTLLQELSLARNHITELEVQNFQELETMRELDFSHNRLRELRPKVFLGAFNLAKINLAHNQISLIYMEAFHGLPKLKAIDLRHNHLRKVFPEPFRQLQSLEILSLTGNPWNCNCHLREFISWIGIYNSNEGPLLSDIYSKGSQLRRFFTEPPRCESPEKHRGSPWSSLQLDEFACGPSITTNSKGGPRTVGLGSKVELSCTVTGDPVSKIVWNFTSNQGFHTRLTTSDRFIIKWDPSPPPAWSPKSSSGPTIITTRLTIRSVSKDDAGQYHCIAQNKLAQAYIVYLIQTPTGLDQDHILLSAPNNELQDGSLNGSGRNGLLGKHDQLQHQIVIIVVVATGAGVLCLLLLISVLCFRRRLSTERARNAAYSSSAFAYANGYKCVPNGTANGNKVCAAAGDGIVPPVNNHSNLSGGQGGHTQNGKMDGGLKWSQSVLEEYQLAWGGEPGGVSVAALRAEPLKQSEPAQQIEQVPGGRRLDYGSNEGYNGCTSVNQGYDATSWQLTSMPELDDSGYLDSDAIPGRSRFSPGHCTPLPYGGGHPTPQFRNHKQNLDNPYIVQEPTNIQKRANAINDNACDEVGVSHNPSMSIFPPPSPLQSNGNGNVQIVEGGTPPSVHPHQLGLNPVRETAL